MAFKEFKVKVTVDTKEGNEQMEKSINTLSGFEEQIGKLRTKLAGAQIGSKEFKELTNELGRTEKAFARAQNEGKGWLDTISNAPGLVGTLGKSLQGVGTAFGNIGMAIKTSLIGLIAGIVIQIVDKMKQFDGVMDPINKVLGIFSGVMSKLANTILPAVTFVVEGVANAISGLANFFTAGTEAGKGYGDILSEMADRTNDLDDATAEYEYQQSLSNAKLAEAREIAADSTKSIKERKEAVLAAAKIEEATAKEGKRIALEKARLLAQQMAVDMNLTTQEIDNLAKADAARLKSFITQQLQNAALNGEKKDALLKQLAQINEIDAASSKIGKKTAATLTGLDNEVAASAKAAAQKVLEAQKNRLNAQIELEKNKAKTDEKLLMDLLIKKDELENKGTKKSKEELELQQQNREKAVKDAIKTDTDAAQAIIDAEKTKNQKIKDEAKKLEDDKLKILLDGQKNRLAEQNVELDRIRILYGEDSEAFKKAQLDIQATRAKSLEEEKLAILSKTEMSDADAQRLRDISIEAANLSNQVLANNQKEIASAKAKVKAQEDLDKAQLEYRMTQAEGDFELQRSIIAEKEALEKEAYDKAIAAAGEDALKKEQIEFDYTKTKDANAKARMTIADKEYQQQIQQAQGVANMLGALSDLVGKDTIAGKALGISQALINTYVGASEAIKQKSTLPSPFDVITKVVNVATIIATGLKTVREITAVQIPTNEVPEVRIRKQMGGILQGPLHSMGGIKTPFGELEGGEYVVNRASTMMFRPQLETINAMGGGAKDLNVEGFGGTINNNNNSEPPIIKTYVVASEMSSQIEMDRIIQQRSKM
jgi:hypothetical protein